jgi:hypothetical protein
MAISFSPPPVTCDMRKNWGSRSTLDGVVHEGPLGSNTMRAQLRGRNDDYDFNFKRKHDPDFNGDPGIGNACNSLPPPTTKGKFARSNIQGLKSTFSAWGFNPFDKGMGVGESRNITGAYKPHRVCNTLTNQPIEINRRKDFEKNGDGCL